MTKPVFVYLMTKLGLRFGEVLCWTGTMAVEVHNPFRKGSPERKGSAL